MASGLPEVQGRAITAPGQIRDAGLAEQAQATMYGRVAQGAMQIGKALEPLAVKAGEEDAIKDWVELEKQNEGRGPGNVTKRSGFLGLTTAGDIAYNNMMETLYLQKTENALLEKAQELQNDPETFGNVDAFDKNFSEFVKGYGAGLDSEFAEEFFLQSEKIANGTRLKIGQAKQEADRAEAISAMDQNIATIQDEILAAELAGSVVGESGRTVEDLYQAYAEQLAIKTQNPLYRYSRAESERDFRGFKSKVMAAGLTPEARDVYATEGYAAALKWADEQAAGLGLPPAETSTIRNMLRNEINLERQNQNAMEAEREAEEKAAKKAREEAADEADRRVTDALLNGQPEEVVRTRLATARNLLSPERYLTLSNKVLDLKNADPMPSGIYASFILAADRGELDEGQIINLPGTAEQLKALIDRSRSYEDDTVKAGRDQIKSLFSKADFIGLDWGEGQSLRVREQEAYNELASWVSEQSSEGKRPRRQEVVDEARRIAARTGQWDALAAGSRYIKRGPSGTLTPAMVSDARDQLAKELKEGRIDRESAREELARLNLIEEGMAYGR